jgi:hypothetical protein
MKKWFASKTLWINAITLLATSAGWLAGMLSAYPEVVAGLVLVQALVNIVLRLITTEAIAA